MAFIEEENNWRMLQTQQQRNATILVYLSTWPLATFRHDTMTLFYWS